MSEGKGDNAGKKCSLLPLSKCSIVNSYAPVIGATSYSLLSINVLNPSLAVSYVSKRDLTNVLLFGTLLGTGCYIYSRPHLAAASNQQVRIFYAGYGSVMFTFGSVLLWAVVRSFLPNNVALGSLAGLGSCYLLATSGKNYLSLIDSQIAKK